MLTIRKSQMEAFDRSSRARLEDDMVSHLGSFAPRHSQALGEAGVRRVIRSGMERSAAHGLTLRGPVRFYIELMFMLGSRFDTDPQLPWAAEALGEPGVLPEMERADLLHSHTLRYARAVAGPGSAHAREALVRLAQEKLEDLPPDDRMFEEYSLSRMREIYPQKWEYVGEATLRRLARSARDLAGRHGVTDGLGIATFVGLMFALGHGFADDPQFPWIESTLKNPTISDPRIRAERLLARAQTYVKQVLAKN
jgi:hypothetical protein